MVLQRPSWVIRFLHSLQIQFHCTVCIYGKLQPLAADVNKVFLDFRLGPTLSCPVLLGRRLPLLTLCLLSLPLLNLLHILFHHISLFPLSKLVYLPGQRVQPGASRVSEPRFCRKRNLLSLSCDGSIKVGLLFIALHCFAFPFLHEINEQKHPPISPYKQRLHK